MFIQFFETGFITEMQKLNEIINEWLSKAITVYMAGLVVILKQNISTKSTVRCWLRLLIYLLHGAESFLGS